LAGDGSDERLARLNRAPVTPTAARSCRRGKPMAAASRDTGLCSESGSALSELGLPGSRSGACRGNRAPVRPTCREPPPLLRTRSSSPPRDGIRNRNRHTQCAPCRKLRKLKPQGRPYRRRARTPDRLARSCTRDDHDRGRRLLPHRGEPAAASSQSSPRVMRSFIRDRVSQLDIGLLVATVVYRPFKAGHVRRARPEGSGPAPCGGVRRGAAR
jgi:hypothetical protein